MAHEVYTPLVRAVRAGRLPEPFTAGDFERTCPGFGTGTYRAFLHKHSRGNPGQQSVLFDRISPGRFRCVRPFKYGL